MKLRLLTLCRVSNAVWIDLMTTFASAALSKWMRRPVTVPVQWGERYSGIIVRVSTMLVFSSTARVGLAGRYGCGWPVESAGGMYIRRSGAYSGCPFVVHSTEPVARANIGR